MTSPSDAYILYKCPLTSCIASYRIQSGYPLLIIIVVRGHLRVADAEVFPLSSLSLFLSHRAETSFPSFLLFLCGAIKRDPQSNMKGWDCSRIIEGEGLEVASADDDDEKELTALEAERCNARC